LNLIHDRLSLNLIGVGEGKSLELISCLPVVGDKSYLMIGIPNSLHKEKNQLVVCNEQLLVRSSWWWPVTSQNFLTLSKTK